MKVSVIIPTFNASAYLLKLLESLSKQTISFELIIIDSSSTDDTLKIAKKYTDNIITIPHSEFDHGGTRTKAAKRASGDIIVFLTQDAIPFDTFTIENLLKPFQNKKVVAIYGRQIPHKNATLFAKHLRTFNYADTSTTRSLEDKKLFGIKTAFLSDSFAAYRKKSLKDIGWFKDALILGEDSYAGAKLLLEGGSLAYEAEAKVHHSHNYSMTEEFKRYFDIGVFHHCENWILKEFGKPEGEGTRYIKSELNYILHKDAWYLIPEFIARCGLKYIGYKLGQKYKILPKWIARSFSMHYKWWIKNS